MQRFVSCARYGAILLIATWFTPLASGQYPGAYQGYPSGQNGISPSLDQYNQPPHAAAPDNRPAVVSPHPRAITNAPVGGTNGQPRADWWNQPSVVSMPGMRAGSIMPAETYTPYQQGQPQESGVWDKIRQAPSATAQWIKGLWSQPNKPAMPAVQQGQPPVYYPQINPGQMPTPQITIPQKPATGPVLGPPAANGQVPFQPSSSPGFPQPNTNPTFAPPPITSSSPGVPWNAPQGAVPGRQYTPTAVASNRDTMTGQPPVGSRFAQPSAPFGTTGPSLPLTGGNPGSVPAHVASTPGSAPLPGVSLYDGGEGNRYKRTAKKKKKKSNAAQQALQRSQGRF